MIVFTLRCAEDHEFEGWFKDSDTFDAEVKARHVACPVCDSTKVVKAPMAPRLGKGKEADAQHAKRMMKQLRELRQHVEANSDYVGEKFADEARKIHYGETDPRSIYGESTSEEAEALKDEGVPFAAIPWVPSHDA